VKVEATNSPELEEAMQGMKDKSREFLETGSKLYQAETEKV
jgi:hypothetical protein